MTRHQALEEDATNLLLTTILTDGGGAVFISAKTKWGVETEKS